MKLSFVSPRYGLDIVGGAEFAVRNLAENCLNFGGIDVEILTTTAGDERTWSKKYEIGEEVINNVLTKRFHNEAIDRDSFDSWASSLLGRQESVSDEEFDEWLKRQGPYSPDLLDAIENCDSDAIVFHPMLSSPASHGVLRAKIPTVLHPALHDEPFARLRGYKEVINKASLLCFSTLFEQNLSQQFYQSDLVQQCVLGFGIEEIPSFSEEMKQEVLSKYGLIDTKYVLVLGRVDTEKGSDLAATLFEEFSKSYDENIKLVFVGPVSQRSLLNNQEFLNQNKSILTTGIVNDEEKFVILQNALCLINPSVTESFSLVVLEAMKAGIPVMVNNACGPTKEHIDRSSSGFTFSGFADFKAAIVLLNEDEDIKEQCIQNGKAYVESFYNWETLVKRYLEKIASVIS